MNLQILLYAGSIIIIIMHNMQVAQIVVSDLLLSPLGSDPADPDDIIDSLVEHIKTSSLEE